MSMSQNRSGPDSTGALASMFVSCTDLRQSVTLENECARTGVSRISARRWTSSCRRCSARAGHLEMRSHGLEKLQREPYRYMSAGTPAGYLSACTKTRTHAHTSLMHHLPAGIASRSPAEQNCPHEWLRCCCLACGQQAIRCRRRCAPRLPVWLSERVESEKWVGSGRGSRTRHIEK